MSGFWQDVRYGLRGMRRSPGFTATVVASLALGIGANTAVFSLMNAVMLRLLPVRHPEQLVELLQKYPGEPRGNGYWTPASFRRFRDHNHVFAELTGMGTDDHARIRTGGGDPRYGVIERVLGNYFSMLGVTPAVGRLIEARDDGVAVISAVCWRERYHGDPGVLGQRIVVNDAPYTIVGVAEPSFVGLRGWLPTEAWLAVAPAEKPGLSLFARLKPGVTIDQARAEMAVLYQFTIEERAARSKDSLVRQLKVELEAAGTGAATVRDRYGRPLTVLMAVAGLLLLLTCINVGGMLLARGFGRRREMAVRAGLGAGRGRLMRQVMTESTLLAVVGALAGIAVAWIGTAALVRIIASGREHERIYLDVQPDWRVLLFGAAVTLLAGVLFGLPPALGAFRAAAGGALRESAKAGETRSRRMLGRGLTAAQTALSVLLVAAAGLFIRHMSDLRDVGLGFRRDHVLLAVLDTAHSGYQRPELARRSEQALAQLEAIPGVLSASLSGATPIQGAGASRIIKAEGFEERPEERRYVAMNLAGPRCFETLGIPLLAGRDFRVDDAGRPRVMIVNRALVSRYFAGRDPIGKHIWFDGDDKPFEIVGVVGDAKYTELRDSPPRTMYLNSFQEATSFSQYVIRTGVDPASLAPAVRAAMKSVLPAAPVEKITTLSDQVDAAMVPERLVAMLSGFFGALGAVLAGIGLYGLLAVSVARRTHEIGIRMALGARRGHVTGMVLGEAALTLGVGLLMGALLAIEARKLAAPLIGNVAVPGYGPMAAACAALACVAAAAVFLPARRAIRIDPLEALRHD
ncbi:MAG: ABC transporter permease [Acidobacteria bacterium]|nr:ABC transporter permease [Acidobacteriota bacterium]